jgi:hemerythrin-like domain-containing protein
LRQHRKIHELIQKLRSDGYRRMTILLSVIEELSAHIAIEDNLLYPTAQRALGVSLKRERDAHQKTKETLACLATARISGDAFVAKVRELEGIFDQHVALEEGALIPELARTLDAGTLEELGDDMERLSSALMVKRGSLGPGRARLGRGVDAMLGTRAYRAAG